MSSTWQGVVIALWAVVLLQTAIIIILYRQVGIVYLGQGSARSRDGLPVLTEAPSWSGKDHRGNIVSSTDIMGRPLVLVFSDPDCGPCQRLMPDIQSFAEETRDSFEVVLVGSGDERVNSQMADRYLLSSPIITQRNREIADKFKVSVTPFLYVIDSHGIIREKGVVSGRKHIDLKVSRLNDTPHEEAVGHA